MRVTDLNGNPWFVLTDMAKILGYRDAEHAGRNVDMDDKGTINLGTPGGKQAATIINESGLYSLILKSRMPNAKAFKRWVTAEVLPAIRKTGGYGNPVPTVNCAIFKGSETDARLWEIAENLHRAQHIAEW